MKLLATVTGLASAANAHTLFTTLFINGQNQGDGTCIRMPHDGETANGPIYPVDGPDMACGRDGAQPVAYTCPASQGSTLTFEFREWTDGSKPGVIAADHRGPCNVYVKKADAGWKDQPAGSGWFKIWEDGFDQASNTWCVDRLIQNNGLLSVDLPKTLPPGYYLVRPELLALHAAAEGDPQFYTGCAQIFVGEGPDAPLEIPENKSASIPGHVNLGMPSLQVNLYSDKPLPAYQIPGPEVWTPSSNGPVKKMQQESGVVPSDCLIKNANWCAKPLAKHSDEPACWASVADCWKQSQACWDTAPPSGSANCPVWQEYCTQAENACQSKQFDGPPQFDLKPRLVAVPGEIPKQWTGMGTTRSGQDNGDGAKYDAPKANPTPAPSAQKGSDKNDSNKDANKGDADDNDSDSDKAADQPVYKSVKPEYETKPVSNNGRCGGEDEMSCQGSAFGNCCSSKGWCGRSTRHCGVGCQGDFGNCRK
ncbi:hypothetical protein CDD82_7976 [Ophiocordyceps australis]|uniref:lytic cellulose monooxygenase (C4-dehydrogenating) n=1 Tax=Ophiocordyceps australis TaxID=1399860 RepID=A0A2C5YNP3_9HYPO|nr:hypothetical protein CDD82_7976 [Ophiocordyceps australis]